MAGNNYAEEWDQAIKQTDKFDGYLIDLRRYGFTLVTGLITASSFLGFQAAVQQVQIGVVFVTIVLVIVLYWLDIYYQNLLNGAALRARVLELFHLDRRLSIYISDTYNKNGLSTFLALIYAGFIAALLILGLVVTNSATERRDTPVKFITDLAYVQGGQVLNTNEIPALMAILIGGSIAGFIAIGVLHKIERTRRKKIDGILDLITQKEQDVKSKKAIESQLRTDIEGIRKERATIRRRYREMDLATRIYTPKGKEEYDTFTINENILEDMRRMSSRMDESFTKEENLRMQAENHAKDVQKIEDEITKELQK